MKKLIQMLQKNPEYIGTGYNKDAKLDENKRIIYEQLHARINALNPKLVIDAGCGDNLHKNKINNLIGFDVMPLPNADQHCNILDAKFNLNSADAVIAYGSIQYLDEQFVRENLKKVISWIKPHGLLEMEASAKRINEKTIDGDRYWWNYDKIDKFTIELNLELEIKPFIVGETKTYVVWTWKKPY